MNTTCKRCGQDIRHVLVIIQTAAGNGSVCYKCALVILSRMAAPAPREGGDD